MEVSQIKNICGQLSNYLEHSKKSVMLGFSQQFLLFEGWWYLLWFLGGRIVYK